MLNFFVFHLLPHWFHEKNLIIEILFLIDLLALKNFSISAQTVSKNNNQAISSAIQQIPRALALSTFAKPNTLSRHEPREIHQMNPRI